jgi:hypothetical protein
MESEVNGESETPPKKKRDLFSFGVVSTKGMSADEIKSRSLVSVLEGSTTSNNCSKPTTLYPPRIIKKKKRIGRPKKYFNWWQTKYMHLICQAMKYKKNATAALHYLRGNQFLDLDGSNPFDDLPRSNLNTWFDPTTHTLKEQYMKYVEVESSHKLHFKKGICENFEVRNELKKIVERHNKKGTYL